MGTRLSERTRAGAMVAGLLVCSVVVVGSSCESDEEPAGPGDSSGILRIVVSTSGVLDTDGYEITVDGVAGGHVDVNATLQLTEPVGSHTVAIEGVATGCTVAEGTSQVVAVPDDESVEVNFHVNCVVAFGSIEVSTSTSGEDPDADGYALVLDGADAYPIGPAATLTIPDLSPGQHVVELIDVAVNCSVRGGPSRNVFVTAGRSVPVTFDIECSGPTGSIEVVATTVGGDLDPDGYSVAVGPLSESVVATNDSVLVDSIPPGVYDVSLGNVALNCTAPPAKQVEVVANAIARVSFTVTCRPGVGSIAIMVHVSGTNFPLFFLIGIDERQVVLSGAGGTINIESVPSGPHEVSLFVYPTCAISGDVRRTVQVTANQTTNVRFDVTCM